MLPILFILKKIYPQAIPYINENRDHVVTRIDNQLYDITGEVTEDGYENWLPLENYNDIKTCKDWSFDKYMMFQCQDCGESSINVIEKHFDKKTL